MRDSAAVSFPDELFKLKIICLNPILLFLNIMSELTGLTHYLLPLLQIIFIYLIKTLNNVHNFNGSIKIFWGD